MQITFLFFLFNFMTIKMDIHKKDNDLNYGKICFFNQNSLFLFMYFFFVLKNTFFLLEVWFIE
jgi:hypothetical protein